LNTSLSAAAGFRLWGWPGDWCSFKTKPSHEIGFEETSESGHVAEGMQPHWHCLWLIRCANSSQLLQADFGNPVLVVSFPPSQAKSWSFPEGVLCFVRGVWRISFPLKIYAQEKTVSRNQSQL